MDTAPIREALDQIDRIATGENMADGTEEAVRGAVRAARRALDAEPEESLGTAEEALGHIVDGATRLSSAGRIAEQDAAKLCEWAGIALADLHDRPQGTAAAADDGPAPEWRRLQYIDRALRWAELMPSGAEVLVGLARQLEEYATGQRDRPTDAAGRALFCPQCGNPDSEGYPREVLDG